MHPIEHLRYLAEAGDASPQWLVPEAAEALAGLADDRSALVMGARKLLEHVPLCGPLWWLCAHALGAGDPRRRLYELIDEFDDDPTPLQVSLALADLSAESYPVEASMLAPCGAIVEGRVVTDGPSTVIAALGTVVPDPVFRAATERRGSAEGRVVPLEVFDRVIRPTGVVDVAVAARRPDMPVVPELLPRW
ncbi:MAG: hypothetical protein JST73_08755 [Actinobacteria bacterium]|nr:hypothetical protein [Actinomycetota bacterium]